ncbi:MAG: NAD(P)-dependent oxidoreductase [Sporomusaceae bacterium]|nr:NAD(P)-dependent oxidoreductase [Sporomusaceae bacterium]
MYLVTGGSGFVGAAVVEALVNAGRRAVVFSRSGSTARLGGATAGVVVERGDVTDAGQLRRVLTEYPVTAIIHLAFATDIGKLEADPSAGIDVNCRGFLNVLEAARAFAVNRVVWTSSAAVYGQDAKYGRLPIDEDASCHPLNVYGAYKVFCEAMAEHYHTKLAVSNIALRPTIVFGSGRWFRGAATYAYDLFHGPAAGAPVTLNCGDQLVDWLYVKDLARAVLLACDADPSAGRVFNICGHIATVREAASVMQELYPEAEIAVLPGKRPMWGPHLSSARAERILGFKTEYSLAAAFRECVDELRVNCMFLKNQ